MRERAVALLASTRAHAARTDALVGHAEEISAIRSYLQDGTRLITLTSIGCVSKTRRATHIAARNYANGARVVTLAHPADGADVVAALSLQAPPRLDLPSCIVRPDWSQSFRFVVDSHADGALFVHLTVRDTSWPNDFPRRSKGAVSYVSRYRYYLPRLRPKFHIHQRRAGFLC